MSRVFLKSLAGPRPNALSRWLQRQPGEPRIAWYPCAGMDYKDLLYFSKRYRQHYPSLSEEPPLPDIYIHSGDVDPKAFDPECELLHESWGTRIVVLQRLVLPNIGSAGDPAGPHSGQAVFLQLRVESCTLGQWKVPLICAAVDPGAMARRMVCRAGGRAKVSHCVLLMPKRNRLTEQNFPQRLVLRIADKIGLEMLITDRLQQDPLPAHHHAASIPDLKTWSILPSRGPLTWSGNNCAEFLVRPQSELISINEDLPTCPQCQLGDRPLIQPQRNHSNPQTDMTIRPVNPQQDLPAIRQLAHRFDIFGPYVQVFENLLLGRPVPGVNAANVEMHVADEAQEGVVGFVAVEWQPDGNNGTAEIHGVAVQPNHACQGIASALLRDVLQRARARKITRLQCITAATENPAALALFTRQGFQVEGNLRPYPNRQTAVRLVYEIPVHPVQPEPVSAQAAEVETRQEPPVGAAQIGANGPQPPWPLPIPYEAIKSYFQSVDCYRVLTGSQAWSRRQWPQGPGVYCIWHTPSNGPRQLLYIGKAGKFKRIGDAPVQLNDGCLASRLQRWTPYCFQSQGPYAEHFEYGPNGSVNEIPKMDHQARYREHIPAREIEVECFVLSGWEQQMSPALLETLLMQDYLQSHGDLPVANNEL